jgi:galactokinase
VIAEKFRAAYGRPPAAIAHAPGRIEFIGNHTDYNGGTVLGASINRYVSVALAPRPDGQRRFRSDQAGEEVALAADRLEKQSGARAWANYPLGVLAALAESGHAGPGGFDFFASSDLPIGAGLSSSAAIELASGLVFLNTEGGVLPPEELARVARRAENQFVGVPCGILDQGVSTFGRRDHLVFIDCRIPSFSLVPLPSAAHFWIFNTHTRHALVDGLYAARHAECMAAAKALGVPLLADATPERVAAAKLPPNEHKRARHVVEEIARVGKTVEALRQGDLSAAGRLLTASHRSSQSLFENSTAELDLLVDTLVGVPGVHGSRLTGGGFGGAVLALTDAGFDRARADEVAVVYESRFGRRPDILHLQTADGASLI